jgi:hypothetical protein
LAGIFDLDEIVELVPGEKQSDGWEVILVVNRM